MENLTLLELNKFGKKLGFKKYLNKNRIELEKNIISILERNNYNVNLIDKFINNEIKFEYKNITDLLNVSSLKTLKKVAREINITGKTRENILDTIIDKINNSDDYREKVELILFDKNDVKKYLSDKIAENDLFKICDSLKIKNWKILDKEKIISKLSGYKKYKISDYQQILLEDETTNYLTIDLPHKNTIKYIFHISDLHIRRNERIKEFKTVLWNFIDEIRKFKYLKNSICIITGDIFHYKTTQKAEGVKLWNLFLKDITQIINVYTILGNHDVDLTSNNEDWISPIDGIFDNFYYLKKSGFYKINNIILSVNSLLDESIIPIENKIKDFKYIALYHGPIDSSISFNGFKFDRILKKEYFGNYDMLLLGDIHKHQYFGKNAAYAGSILQQNKGESIKKHGYILWNIVDNTSEFKEIYNPYCFLKVTIKDNNIVYNHCINKMKKKYLYVTYDLHTENYLSILNAFKKKINSTIKIISEEYNKLYTGIQLDEKIIEEKINDYIPSDIIDIHNSILESSDESQNIRKIKWSLKSLKFRNVFNFGSDEITEILFNDKGFYKIFGDNFIGKTSIINMIKWGIYGEHSGISNSSIMYKGTKKLFNESFIEIIFIVNNIKYIMSKTVKLNGKIIYELSHGNTIIKSRKNVEEIILNILGSYDYFELIASINNNDLGILKSKKSYEIFRDLFKLDRFEKYLEKAKDELRDLKAELKTIKKLTIQQDETELNELIKTKEKFNISEIENKINKIKTEITGEKNKLSYEVLSEIEKIKMPKKPNNFVTFDEIKNKDIIKNIPDLTQDNYIEKIKEVYEQFKLYDYSLFNKIDETENIAKIKNEINAIKIVDNIKEKEIEKTELLNEKKPIFKVKKYFGNLNDINNKIDTLKQKKYELEQIGTVIPPKSHKKNSDLDEAKNMFLNLFKTHKNNEEIKMNNKTLNKIKSVIENFEYFTYEKLRGKSINIKEELNKNEKILNNLIDEKSEILKINETIEINKKHEKINSEINDKLISINKYINEYYELKNKKNDLYNTLNILNRKQEEYLLYKESQIKYETRNKLNKILINVEESEKYLTDITKYEKYTEIANINAMIMKNINNLENDLDDLEEDYNDTKLKLVVIEKDIEIINEKIKLEYEEQNRFNDINMKIDKLKKYSEYMAEIPSKIMDDRIPIIQDEINAILKGYTNFQCLIKVNKKTIDFYQYKLGSNNLIGISSCSGYELFILNIAMKMAIKKLCYINFPNFICIDEVWEKISIFNFDKLKNIFKILYDNYDIIFVISHIEDIKNILDDSFNGIYINIEKHKNYSSVSKHFSTFNIG